MPIEVITATKKVGTVKDALEKNGEDGIEKREQIDVKIQDDLEDDISELADKFSIENIKNTGDGVKIKLDEIKNLTFEQLREKMEQKLEQTKEHLKLEGDREGTDESDEVKKEGLTEDEKAKIKEETGWSDEIIEAIGSWEEYEIYKEAGLVEAEIGGRKCLIRNDIDWEQKDAMGRTNKERVEEWGLSPINKDGKVIELHHIGQHSDSPLAELTKDEHRGKGNNAILHDMGKESEIDRKVFASERNNHWEERSKKSEETE